MTVPGSPALAPAPEPGPDREQLRKQIAEELWTGRAGRDYEATDKVMPIVDKLLTKLADTERRRSYQEWASTLHFEGLREHKYAREAAEEELGQWRASFGESALRDSVESFNQVRRELATTREERRVLWHLLKLSTKRRWLETGAIMDAARRDWNLLNSVIEAKDELFGRSDDADAPSETAPVLARAADAPSELVTLPSDWVARIDKAFASAWHYNSARSFVIAEIEGWGTATQPTSPMQSNVQPGTVTINGVRRETVDPDDGSGIRFPEGYTPVRDTPDNCGECGQHWDDHTGTQSGLCVTVPPSECPCGIGSGRLAHDSDDPKCVYHVAAPSPEEKQATARPSEEFRNGIDWCPQCRIDVGTLRYTHGSYGPERCGNCDTDLIRRPAGGTGDPT
jgi:hypothetical protein